VLDGFHKTVACTLLYWLAETDHVKSNPDPLLEAQLQLKGTDILFVPSMTPGHMEGFYGFVEELIGSVFIQGSLIPRVASHLKELNYQVYLIIIFFPCIFMYDYLIDFFVQRLI